MSRPIQSKFKVYEELVNQENYFNKLVDERAFFEVYPNLKDYEYLEPARRQVAAYARNNIIGADGTLMDVFKSSARVVQTNKRYVTWRLYTNEGDIRASFIKNFEEDNPCPGKGHSVFEIGLDAEWFGPNDIIIFEGLRECPLLVVSKPDATGQYFKYEVQLLSDDRAAYFPIEYLEEGTRLIQIGSLIGEATVERGNIHFGDGEAFVEFEVPLTRMGWDMKITDNAYLASKNYRVERCNPDGTPMRPEDQGSDTLINSLEMKFMEKTNRQKDLWLTYGRSAGRFAGRFLDGITEKPIQTGPGLFEFLESSYIYDFNVEGGSIEMFREFLPSLWNDKVDPNQQSVDIYTGKGGLILLQKWIKEADCEGVLQEADLHYTKDSGYFPGRNGVVVGAKQYRGFYIEPFGLVKFHYLPFLDSELIETRRYKGLPWTSYEFIVFNYGYGDVRDSNIYVVENSEVEQYGYSVGTWGPLGPTLKGSMHNRFFNGEGHKNEFRYIHECMVGLVMKDPSYAVWYRPKFK